jgi:DnaJ-class molecular chaperone
MAYCSYYFTNHRKLTSMSELVKTICPRCNGNGFIRIQDLLGEDIDQMDCPQCSSQGWILLPEELTFINEDGGRESIIKKGEVQNARQSL